MTEPYGEFLPAFHAAIAASHPHAYGAFIRVGDDSLALAGHAF